MEGPRTIVADLLNACAHPAVARAALGALRRDLVDRVALEAKARRLPVGAFVAQEVRRFADRADGAACGRLAGRMRRAEMPLAAGLEAILDEATDAPQASVHERGRGW